MRPGPPPAASRAAFFLARRLADLEVPPPAGTGAAVEAVVPVIGRVCEASVCVRAGAWLWARRGEERGAHGAAWPARARRDRGAESALSRPPPPRRSLLLCAVGGWLHAPVIEWGGAGGERGCAWRCATEKEKWRGATAATAALLLVPFSLARSFRFDTSLLPPMLSLRAAALGAPAALALRGSSSRARSMSAWRGVPEKRDRGDEAPHSTLSSIHPHPPTPHSLVLGRQQHQRRQVHQARHPAPGRRRGRHAGRPPGPPSVAGAGRGGAEWRQRLGGGGQGMRERREREGERPESRSKRISWWPCSRARGRTRALWWCGQGRG